MDNNPFRTTNANNAFQYGSATQSFGTLVNNATPYGNAYPQTTQMTGMPSTTSIQPQPYSPMGFSQQTHQQYLLNQQNAMQPSSFSTFDGGNLQAQTAFSQPGSSGQFGLTTPSFYSGNTTAYQQQPQPYTQQQQPQFYSQQQQPNYPQQQPSFTPQLQQQSQYQPQQYNPSNMYIPPNFGLSSPQQQYQQQQSFQPRHPPVDASALLKAGTVRKEVCPICHKTIEGDDPAINHHVNEHLE